MKLESENDGTIREPSENDITRAIRQADGYLILGPDELTYLQAAGSAESGFVLEYQEGDTDRHFRSVNEALPVEQVIGAFLLYARSDAAFKNGIEWQPLEL